MRRRIGTRAGVLFALSVSLPAPAMEAGSLAGEPVRLDITNATSVSLNVNNRNTRPADVTRVADDDWGLWNNRLNAQASWTKWQVGLRLDSALFFTRPTPTEAALTLLSEENGGRLPDTFDDRDARFFVQMLRQADAELSNKYINWIYPAKYTLGYTTPDIEATVGDFYAQLGRGLVLSVRKLDELSSDTTVRGGRATGRIRAGDFRLKLTALGGVMNPLRVDDASGRYLSVDGRVTEGLSAFTEAGMPRPASSAFQDAPLPTYAPDRLAAAQIEGGTPDLLVGLQGSFLDRFLLDADGNGTEEALSPSAARSADDALTSSISVSAPDLFGHGAAYVEVAVQNLDYPAALEDQENSRLPDTGHAVYASLNAHEGPVTLTAEAKHYRRFFPLQANVDIGRAREFSLVQYNQPPTTGAFWLDTELEGFNTCVSGGRAKTDVEVGRDESVFVWVGRYFSWAESVSNEECQISDGNKNSVWDLATGMELVSDRRRSRANTVIGSRFDDTSRSLAEPISGAPTNVFYRELYARYDVIRYLGGPVSLQFQGWHRRRYQTLGGPDDWWYQGLHLTAVQWAPHWIVGFGIEYDGNPQFPDTYFNGQVTYNIDSASNVTIFAGQRRGGLRCVSGVCRVFPPFEGVRADATLRF